MTTHTETICLFDTIDTIDTKLWMEIGVTIHKIVIRFLFELANGIITHVIYATNDSNHMMEHGKVIPYSNMFEKKVETQFK